MTKEPIQLKLRPFTQTDFGHLISWVSTSETLGQWCAAFFRYPLDEDQLQRYLDSASQPNVRTIFTALAPSGEAVGHIEVSMIWPHLSSRLSRIIVAPGRRGEGVGDARVREHLLGEARQLLLAEAVQALQDVHVLRVHAATRV